MAVLRTFKITLHRVTAASRGSICISIGLGAETPSKVVQASTSSEVVTIATRFAQEHGEPCAALVRLTEGRKPSGFDEATRNLHFNLDKLEQPSSPEPTHV
jgi:hypothetical protein